MTHNKSLLTLVKYTTQIILMNLVLNIVSGSNDCSQPGIQMEPDEEDCACYFVCEEGKRGKHVCCDYGQWHMLKAEGVNPCVPVGEFSANYQNKCFLRMKGELWYLSGKYCTQEYAKNLEHSNLLRITANIYCNRVLQANCVIRHFTKCLTFTGISCNAWF